MRAIADTHTHTLASGHAFGTILENAAAAKAKGLRFLCVTDHTAGIPDAPQALYFRGLYKMLPEEVDGVYLLSGCEVNVLDETGALDLSQDTLKGLNWVIASMHTLCTKNMTVAECTQAWLNVAKNTDVDVMGHLGDERFAFDHERVIVECAKYNKIVEINAHSNKARPGSAENCRDIARLCAKHRVPVVISTDAHFPTAVGVLDNSIALLESIDFPEELVLNIDFKRFADVLTEKTGRVFEV